MKIKLMDTGKNAIFLLMILVVFITSGIAVLIKMKTDVFETYLSDDKILKVLVVIEDNGNPISSNVIAYYPETKRSAMFDIPSNTGLIIQSLNRTDGIGAVYTEKGIESFKKEIEKLTGISIPIYMTCTLENFAELTDMLGGLSVFIPTPVDIDNEAMRILLPSGSVALDGDKMRDYLIYEDELDGDGEAALRKQKAFLAMLRAVNDNSPDIFSEEKFQVVQNNFTSNIKGEDFKKLIEYLCKMDSERLVPQRLTGTVRYVEEKKLLFPFRDGQQLKEIIRQAIAVLASEDSSALERIYALEILNGTNVQGLAKNTSEVYQSFGYDVIQVGNTEEPAAETVLIDRIGNSTVAKIVAQVIRCKNIRTTQLPSDAEYGSETNVDFTIILGSDFNGYYVVPKK
ncbi:LCP family protein [Treponema pedis]|uniref:LCP family protein n=1 Tax=Treponema pedis TaxID=409322 RepID=UPI0004089801|nr:LCP family protein [Treponema pedis]